LYESSVDVFEFIDWNEKHQLPNSTNNFFKILDAFTKTTRRVPCLVSCNDGITACGLFVVLSYIIEKYEKELEIDVCNGIRIARRSGRDFVNNAVRKYKLLTLCIKWKYQEPCEETN
jgi:protein tyrosine phosphatase